MMIFKILVFLVLLLAQPVFSAEYYIDFVGGADTNNGTAAETPFQHTPGDPACSNTCGSTSIAAGDKVYFKKGVTYTIGAGDSLTLTASGSNPANGTTGSITAPGVLTDTNATFQTANVAAGDYLYIYNNSTTGAWINTVGIWSIASVDSETQVTLTSFDGSAHATAELTYKIYRPIEYTTKTGFGTGTATIDGNSATYTLIDLAGKNYIRFAGITLANTTWPAGYPGASCTNTTGRAIYEDAEITGLILDTLVFSSHWKGVSTDYLQYSITKGCTASNIGSLVFSVGSYSLFEDNTISDGGSVVRSAGLYSVVRYNTITDCAHSSAFYCGTHSDGIGPFFSPSASPGSNQYGWIYGNYIANTVMGIFLEYNNGGTSYWTIHSNVLIGYYGAGGSGSAPISVNTAPYTKIYNNTIIGIDGSTGWASGISIEDNSPNCTIKNNLIYGLDQNSGITIRTAASAVGVSIDNNVYYIPDRTSPNYYVNAFKTFAQWQDLGFDTNGSNGVDPSFVDATGATYDLIDLRLAADSPFVDWENSAILAAVTRDPLGTIRPQNSILEPGAYENIGGVDLAYPTISITAPATGNVFGASVTISADCSDNVACTSVQFKKDGANLGSLDSASPWSIFWDTTTEQNKSLTLTAAGCDAANNCTTSSGVVVSVANIPASGGSAILDATGTGSIGLSETGVGEMRLE